MSSKYRGEYDDYIYPEPLREETPESREMLKKLRNEFAAKAKKMREEAKSRKTA